MSWMPWVRIAGGITRAKITETAGPSIEAPKPVTIEAAISTASGGWST